MKDFVAIAKNEGMNGLVEEADLVKLLKVVSSINPKVILEVGVRQGKTFKSFINAFDPEIAIGIDLELKDNIPGASTIPIIPTPPAHYLWGMDSHQMSTLEEVQKILNGREVDFLFIDGDHTLEGVTKDWEMYGPLVKEGGIVAFHDVVKIIQGEGLNGERVECKILFDKLKETYNSLLINEVTEQTMDLAIPSGVGLIYI